ncbi:MAG: DUF3089 domain-containing protein [Lentisphaerae bacterium]|nr:DUF3089 domain-containing protein [Lentisphaerota bacterium]
MEEKMKQFIYCLIAASAVLTFTGCSSTSPYDYGTNWLIRENDIPQFYARYDLFYIGKAPAGYGDTHDIQFNWTKTHTNDIFGRGVRVFAPEIQEPDVKNVTAALEYYLENFHKEGHPFILLAEGKSADLLYSAMQKVDGINVENGFIAAYLPDMQPKTAAQIAEDFYWDGLKAAANADDCGVIVTWTSCINNEKTAEMPNDVYNINPLNWQTDSTAATAAENIKAVFYMPEHKNIFWRKVEAKNFSGAVIDPAKGVLNINCPLPLLHVVNGRFTNNCISIFAGNIAANADRRTKNLIKAREWKSLK